MRSGISATQSIAGSTIEAIAKTAIIRKMMTHRPAASLDGTPRRSNHSSIGTSAIAITSAAVTGRKNSAPARSANGSARISPMPRDQGQRGEQPVALDAVEQFGRMLRVPRRSPVCPSCIHGPADIRADARAATKFSLYRYLWCPWSDSNGHSLGTRF